MKPTPSSTVSPSPILGRPKLGVPVSKLKLVLFAAVVALVSYLLYQRFMKCKKRGVEAPRPEWYGLFKGGGGSVSNSAAATTAAQYAPGPPPTAGTAPAPVAPVAVAEPSVSPTRIVSRSPPLPSHPVHVAEPPNKPFVNRGDANHNPQPHIRPHLPSRIPQSQVKGTNPPQHVVTTSQRLPPPEPTRPIKDAQDSQTMPASDFTPLPPTTAKA